MKIKESDLKKIIKESILEEFLNKEEEKVVDIWANLINDASYNRKWSAEFFNKVPRDVLIILGFDEDMIRTGQLQESVQQFKKEIKRAIKKPGNYEKLKSALDLLTSAPITGKWLKDTYGYTSATVARPPTDPTAVPEDIPPDEEPEEPTTAEPDISVPMSSTAQRTAVLKKNSALRAQASFNKILNNPDDVDRLEKASDAFKTVVRGVLDQYPKIGANPDSINRTAQIMAKSLKNMGVTRVSESRLKQIILEEMISVLRESRRR
jgi:hypothetical protein